MITLYPLQVAKNVKNEFQNLQTGFMEEGLVMFKHGVKILNRSSNS